MIHIRYETEIEHPVSLHRRKKHTEEYYCLTPAEWAAELAAITGPEHSVTLRTYYRTLYGTPIAEVATPHTYSATYQHPWIWDHTQTVYTHIHVEDDGAEPSPESERGYHDDHRDHLQRMDQLRDLAR